MRIAEQSGLIWLSGCTENKYFRNDRVVSKLVAIITCETRYEAAKVEYDCVLYFIAGNRLEDPKNEDFWHIKTYYKQAARPGIQDENLFVAPRSEHSQMTLKSPATPNILIMLAACV